jgi:hypothetical protein
MCYGLDQECGNNIQRRSTFENIVDEAQTIIQHSFEHCPINIMGDFYVNILKNNNPAKIIRIHG